MYVRPLTETGRTSTWLALGLHAFQLLCTQATPSAQPCRSAEAASNKFGHKIDLGLIITKQNAATCPFVPAQISEIEFVL
jgi:hypothetical protein